MGPGTRTCVACLVGTAEGAHTWGREAARVRGAGGRQVWVGRASWEERRAGGAAVAAAGAPWRSAMSRGWSARRPRSVGETCVGGGEAPESARAGSRDPPACLAGGWAVCSPWGRGGVANIGDGGRGGACRGPARSSDPGGGGEGAAGGWGVRLARSG